MTNWSYFLYIHICSFYSYKSVLFYNLNMNKTDIINLVNTFATTTNQQPEMPVAAKIIYVVLGILFCLGCGLLIWYYFNKKDEWERTRSSYEKYKAGSFKGFWGRMRAPIIVFLAVLLLILGIFFVGAGLLEWVPHNDIVGP